MNESNKPLNVLIGCGIGIIILIVLAFIFGWPLKVVGSTETAVAERWGKITGERQPGVHVEFFTKYRKYDTKLITHNSVQAAATSDLQDVNVDVTVTYRLQPNKVVDIYRNIGDHNDINEKALKPVIAQVFKSISTQYKGEELVQKRNEISSLVREQLTSKLSSEYFLDVTEVSITNLTFTNPDFNAAIDQKQIAEQQTLKAQYELERARVDAETAKVQQTTLTPEILQKMWLDKWNGVLPSALYVTNEQAGFVFPVK